MSRDQNESAFTGILRRLWHSVPNLLSAAFVDLEGECIDYVSSVDPFEAKVAGAHVQVMLNALRDTRTAVNSGEPYALEITTDTHELWGRRVTDEHVLVVLLLPGCDRAQLRLVMREVSAAFRVEAGFDSPAWDAQAQRLRVRVRPTDIWPYAPDAFWQSEERMDVSDVLGRWHEPRAGVVGPHGSRICFRVRTVSGQELTLVHHVLNDLWSLRA